MAGGIADTSQLRPVTIGVAGGTGSGKTTVSTALLERVGAHRIAYIPHDAYYFNWDDLPRGAGWHRQLRSPQLT